MDKTEQPVEEKKEEKPSGFQEFLEKAKEKITEEKTVVTNEEKAALREAHVCAECLGEGLLGDPSGKNKTCPVCHGTGKVA